MTALYCEGGPLHGSVREVPEEALPLVEFAVEEDGRVEVFLYRLEWRPSLVFVSGHSGAGSRLLTP